MWRKPKDSKNKPAFIPPENFGVNLSSVLPTLYPNTHTHTRYPPCPTILHDANSFHFLCSVCFPAVFSFSKSLKWFFLYKNRYHGSEILTCIICFDMFRFPLCILLNIFHSNAMASWFTVSRPDCFVVMFERTEFSYYSRQHQPRVCQILDTCQHENCYTFNAILFSPLQRVQSNPIQSSSVKWKDTNTLDDANVWRNHRPYCTCSSPTRDIYNASKITREQGIDYPISVGGWLVKEHFIEYNLCLVYSVTCMYGSWQQLFTFHGFRRSS